MFHPKKSLGQNFLIDRHVLPPIIKAAEIKKDDIIIEIGPGRGILTEELVKTGAQIFAVEKDYELAEFLRRTLGKNKNLKIIHQDALWFDLSQFKSYKVAANIPYNITSPLIRKFLESENRPELMVLMVQKEVAERIAARPGSSERGLLTLIVEFYAQAEILFEVSRKEFYPIPKVDSAVIKIQPYLQPRSWNGVRVQPEFFFKLVKAGFASKRRQIHNSLVGSLPMDKNTVTDILKQARINPRLRAEDLTLKDWLRLGKIFKDLQKNVY